LAASDRGQQLLAVHEVLDKLATEHPAQAEVVKLRYFAGMTNEETAQVLGVSVATVKNYWTFARTWIFHEIRNSQSASRTACARSSKTTTRSNRGEALGKHSDFFGKNPSLLSAEQIAVTLDWLDERPPTWELPALCCCVFFQMKPIRLSLCPLFAGRRQHAANHAKGFTTNRRRGGVSRAQHVKKTVGRKTNRHDEVQDGLGMDQVLVAFNSRACPRVVSASP